ncbi:MAG: thioredoxin [Candidatus Omnitrophota bacterium]
MSLIHLNDENFKKEILEAKKPALVDFYATWCGPCKMVAPVIEELAKEYADKFKIGKLNVEEAQEIATKYAIMSVPTFLFFKNGKVVGQVVGALSRSEFKKKIDSVLS